MTTDFLDYWSYGCLETLHLVVVDGFDRLNDDPQLKLLVFEYSCAVYAFLLIEQSL